MITHCTRHGENTWPWVIQFETMGHCDIAEGPGTEWRIIRKLIHHQYVLVHFSWHDTHLVRRQHMRDRRIHAWSHTFVCDHCQRTGLFPYTTDNSETDQFYVYCRVCMWEDPEPTVQRCEADSLAKKDTPAKSTCESVCVSSSL